MGVEENIGVSIDEETGEEVDEEVDDQVDEVVDHEVDEEVDEEADEDFARYLTMCKMNNEDRAGNRKWAERGL